MQSFLIDADARQGESERVRLWVSEIRDLAYNAEDVIETFALRIGSKREGGCSNVVKRYACILKEGWMLHKIRSEIEEIITEITDLTQRLQTYGIKELRDVESTSSREKQERRRSYPHVVEDNVVGLNDEIKELVSVITDEDGRSYRSVSICGIGGSGKTTLAKMIYHHSQVRSHFNHFAWVYISQQCQRRKVWEDILSGLGIMDEEDREKRDEDLVEKLFTFFKNKKCLVILDDLWSIEAWDSIKPAFAAAGDTTSKILLTSRDKKVAAYVDRRGYLHELKCLEGENSWELFQRTAFPDRSSPENRVDARMEELGKDMVRRCAGLPLAIVVLGGILATKNSLNEWQRVSENVKLYINRGRGQGIDDVLGLSYENLPPYLKPCFLYLSNFPEDYEIPADRLIQLWVAEGFVSLSRPDEGNGLMEDVAEDYLIELVERCMIEVGKRDALSRIKTCRMHDLMRDLCLSKAKQENFLYIIDRSSENQCSSNSFSSIIRGVRRISAHVFPQLQCIKSPHLRSLLFFFEFNPCRKIIPLTDPKMLKMVNYIYEHEDMAINPVFWIFIFRVKYMLWRSWVYMFINFRLLRVLYFGRRVRDAGWNLPGDVGNLIHLRFLSLKGLGFFMSKFPSSLGNLKCLRTLDLRVDRHIWKQATTDRSIHVPNVIWQMKQLRYLYLPKHCDSKTKLRLGNLTNLLKLVNFNVRNCYVGDLLNMINLRKLKIYGLFHVEDFEVLGDNPPILGNNNTLRSLSIRCHESIDPRHLTHLISNCANIYELKLVLKIGKLPEHHHFSSNIAYIYLAGCELDEDPMPILGKLSNLRVLQFDDAAFAGKEMACSAQSFAKLDSLCLRRTNNLEEWKVDEGAMPVLRHLEIYGCFKLKMLPDGLRLVTTLQELKINWMPKAFKDKVVEGGEDFYKVQHIPCIKFQNCNQVII